MQVAVEGAQPVIIYRLDSGGARERGVYRCSECAWEGTCRSPQSHVNSAHPGRPQKTERQTPRPLKQDPSSLAKRKWDQEHRARKKVRERWGHARLR